MKMLESAHSAVVTHASPKSISLMLMLVATFGMNVSTLAQESPYADPAEPALPQTSMLTTLSNTALVRME
jgi:hypothetical protein